HLRGYGEMAGLRRGTLIIELATDAQTGTVVHLDLSECIMRVEGCVQTESAGRMACDGCT
ncbi:uncharacterized protein LAESUDRAFT_732584, partial [Laetiporus sulphureus 93-53]